MPCEAGRQTFFWGAPGPRALLPSRNLVFEKVQTAGSLTDAELAKALAKAETGISGAAMDKILLDLEILGLVNVTWIAKDTRRIEAVKEKAEPEDAERGYESSFPGAG